MLEKRYKGLDHDRALCLVFQSKMQRSVETQLSFRVCFCLLSVCLKGLSIRIVLNLHFAITASTNKVSCTVMWMC